MAARTPSRPRPAHGTPAGSPAELRRRAAAAEASGHIAAARAAWRAVHAAGPEGALGREASVELARLGVDPLAVRWGAAAVALNLLAWVVALAA